MARSVVQKGHGPVESMLAIRQKVKKTGSEDSSAWIILSTIY